MTLLTDSPWKAIKAAASASTTPARVAVAYFGTHGDTLLPLAKGSKLVVDCSLAAVETGITNPTALLRLHTKGVQIFTTPLLHAKVFAFDGVGFIGSTNASRRSERNLIEAVARVSDAPTLLAIRDFVESLASDRLNSVDLKWLEGRYTPPKAPLPSLADTAHKRLVMQIVSSDQQGYSGHQVQPPLPAWQHYFGVTMSTFALPTYRLRNSDTGDVIDRKVVRHTQVLTVDIPEAAPGTIWEVRKVGRNRYDYRVISPGTASFVTLDKELNTKINPLRHSGRLWFIE
jgi:hypothetical protein